MLIIKDIKKEYITGDLKQTALNNVSLGFRDSEFVAILGPSGSGKTTLLNIIGGLDRYDSGDLIINGISTKKYKDRDWDSYRNHTIGFVFQSYNLIPHQSILSNVELALTISGISKSERKKRAAQALEKVGLGDQLHKRPGQMSGGQMQRVAIARALVNDPDILLADEPTGALDSDTSIQVMDMLKEVAKDRLVIMVTHNPELADRYATRTVRLKDGMITDDTQPFETDDNTPENAKHKSMGKASMSKLTSLGLSFNNLRTKKGRTILTSFAGSIGIIGIALILSLSNGVNNYIDELQKSTMSSYPISIESRSIDMNAIMEMDSDNARAQFSGKEAEHEMDGVYVDSSDLEERSTVSMSIMDNNLSAFKKYLDDENSEIQKYIGENGVVYTYDTRFCVLTYDDDGEFVNTDGSTLNIRKTSLTQEMLGGSSYGTPDEFSQLISGKDGEMIASAIKDNYEVVYGRYPEKYDEIVLVLNSNNEIPSSTLYELGILPTREYKELMDKIDDDEKIEHTVRKLDYDEVCKKEYRLIPQCDMFVKNENGLYKDISGSNSELKELYDKGISLKIVGILKPGTDDNDGFIEESAGFSKGLINGTVGYTKALTDYIIEYTDNSEPVKAQKADESKSVITGLSFVADDDKTKAADAKTYIENLSISEKATLFMNMLQSMGDVSNMGILPFSSDGDMDMPEGFSDQGGSDETALASALDEYLKSPDSEILLQVYDKYISGSDYKETLDAMGAVSLDSPSTIDIYADSFEDKEKIQSCIDDYNSTADENDRITYTDFVKLIMSSVTDMINAVSYVLIAFVAVSLVVSSIMIGIITYISVLERTKEIGILRAIGASKRNITQVFNAETFIIGLFAGLIGIVMTLLLLVPTNMIIHSATGNERMNAELPVLSGLILVALSVVLTLIGGFIPSKKAAKKDPVTALRTE